MLYPLSYEGASGQNAYSAGIYIMPTLKWQVAIFPGKRCDMIKVEMDSRQKTLLGRDRFFRVCLLHLPFHLTKQGQFKLVINGSLC